MRQVQSGAASERACLDDQIGFRLEQYFGVGEEVVGVFDDDDAVVGRVDVVRDLLVPQLRVTAMVCGVTQRRSHPR